MPFFGFADSCDLRKWTYFRLYHIFVTVSRFSKNTLVVDTFREEIFAGRKFLGLLVLSRLALCASEIQQTINEERANKQGNYTIAIFYTFDRYFQIFVIWWIQIHNVSTIEIVFTVLSFKIDKVWRRL